MKMLPFLKGNRRPRLIYGSIVVACFMFGVTGAIPIPSIKVQWPERSGEASKKYVPDNTRHYGKEVVMVYIGSSDCGFANDPQLPGLIEEAKLAVQAKAYKSGFHFAATGVSIDWATERGIQHLAKFGYFDEIVTGRNWQGMGARYYIWGTLSGAASTPQVLVVVRTVEAPSPERPSQPYLVSDEFVAVRKSGVTEIAAWVDRGSPIPSDLMEP